MNIITLNSKTLHNVTIIDNSIRYTRLIDNKLYTFEYHCDNAIMTLDKLSVLSNSTNDTFKLMCSIAKSLRDETNE